jgi:hypothetical protein
LLAGRFDYALRGILDSTHLRFFTRKSLRALHRAAGFRSVHETTTVMPAELALGLPHDSLPALVLNRILAAAAWLWPGLFGYQIMHVLTADENLSQP